MTTVVDASALLGLLSDAHDAVRSALGDRRLAAPEIVDLEVTSALRRQARAGERTIDDARRALAELVALPELDRYAHRPLVDRVWQLRENITAYDASYVALAEVLRAPLVTLDRRLARAAEPFCDVIVPG